MSTRIIAVRAIAAFPTLLRLYAPTAVGEVDDGQEAVEGVATAIEAEEPTVKSGAGASNIVRGSPRRNLRWFERSYYFPGRRMG
jgi:hypothetical protein